jgi:putative ATP-dependent endonuclease of OLD family
MRLLALTVKNFRGIKSLEWVVGGDVVCLVGCGDSTKTTILDAIELVLSPRWNVPFGDSDFYGCEIDQPISIGATVTDLPKALKNDSKFGMDFSAWDPHSHQLKEYEDGEEPVLLIELRVDKDLEPEWLVVAPDDRDPRHISSRDREALGVARLGEYVDRHATWARGSSLARMGDGTASVREVLAQAQRDARAAVRDMKDTELHKTAKEVQDLAAIVGVSPREEYLPGLDTRSIGDGAASLCLHDGDVPLRMSGLGTRRLLAATIQRSAAKSEGAILVDEVEHGLEPFRLTHLLRVLTQKSATSPQIFLTTHSSVTVSQLGAEPLRIVRCSAGEVTILRAPTDIEFDKLARSVPEAFVGRKVIVVEGPTEGGLCWALEKALGTCSSFALYGVVIANGGGNAHGPKRAIQLAELGYGSAFFGDSDEMPIPPPSEMDKKGVKCWLWDGGCSTDQRVMLDLPITGLQEAVNLARSSLGDESVIGSIRARLQSKGKSFNGDIQVWLDQGGDESILRKGLGESAKERKWFKEWTRGESLGEIVVKHRSAIAHTDLIRKTNALLAWALEPPW